MEIFNGDLPKKNIDTHIKVDTSEMIDRLYEVAKKYKSIAISVEEMEDTFLYNMGNVIEDWSKWRMFVNLYRSSKYKRPHIGFVTSKEIFDVIKKNTQPFQNNTFQLLGYQMTVEHSPLLKGLMFLPLPNREKPSTLELLHSTTTPKFYFEKERRNINSHFYMSRGFSDGI